MYDSPTDIGNPAYSLVSDTLYYFLTWTSGSARRFIKETDVNFSAYSPSDFVWDESIVNYNSHYYGGYSAYSSYSSFYSAGEGWGGPKYDGIGNFTLNVELETTEIYNGSNAPDAQFHAKSNAVSNANFTGNGNHHLRWEIGNNQLLLHDEVFSGYRQTVVDTLVPMTELTEGTTNAYFNIIDDQGAVTDFQSLSYVSLKYPRKTNTTLAFFEWEIPHAGLQAKSYLAMDAPNLSAPTAYIFDDFFAREIPLVSSAGQWNALIPNAVSGGTQKMVVASESTIQTVANLSAVNGNGFFTNYSQLDPEEAYIILYNKVMASSVNNYSAYRASSNGGGHNVIKLEVNDAWMQYGGGVPKHIMGSRRAVQHIYNRATVKPVGLFIAGKGITEASAPNTGSSWTPRKKRQCEGP